MWIEEENRSAEGGHCAGMAALSAAFFMESESAADFGADQAHALQPDDLQLLRTISAYFSMQALAPVSTAVRTARGWSLQEVIDHLVADLKERKDYPTLGINYEDGGHAVTPYRVVARGPGLYRIDLYDNNYPGAEKFIDVDVTNDRWTYAGAALNPSEVAR